MEEIYKVTIHSQDMIATWVHPGDAEDIIIRDEKNRIILALYLNECEEEHPRSISMPQFCVNSKYEYLSIVNTRFPITKYESCIKRTPEHTVHLSGSVICTLIRALRDSRWWGLSCGTEKITKYWHNVPELIPVDLK